MQKKTIKLTSLFLLAVMVISACSMSGGNEGNENVSVEETASSADGSGVGEATSISPTEELPAAGGGQCANAYYPVREGSTWNYKITSNITDDQIWTDTITDVRDDGFTLTSVYDELTRTQEWACTPDGLLALQMGGGAAGGLTVAGAQLTVETQNVSGVTYPSEMNAGSQWSQSHEFTGTMDIAGQSAEVTGDEQSNFTAIGVESVSVPAGTFEAMKVEVLSTININSTFQGVTVPVTFTGTTTSWYAQGVGWVKSTTNSDFGGMASTDTIELQWYNIP